MSCNLHSLRTVFIKVGKQKNSNLRWIERPQIFSTPPPPPFPRTAWYRWGFESISPSPSIRMGNLCVILHRFCDVFLYETDVVFAAIVALPPTPPPSTEYKPNKIKLTLTHTYTERNRIKFSGSVNCSATFYLSSFFFWFALIKYNWDVAYMTADLCDFNYTAVIMLDEGGYGSLCTAFD